MSGPILACYRIGTEVISTDLALLPRIRASPDFRRAGALSLQLLIAGKKKFILEGPRPLHPRERLPPNYITPFLFQFEPSEAYTSMKASR